MKPPPLTPAAPVRPLGERSLRPRVGLALSSGGARGLAHVGVIQVLEENGIPVHAIAGASMGAYVGALWAAGHDGAALAAFAGEINSPRDLWRRLDLALPPVRGLFRGEMLRSRLHEALRGATFETLERELHVVAANLDTFERRIFTRGDVASAVHASAAIPGVCVPVEIDGQRYGDGGIVDPLPVGVLRRAGCERIIAVNVLPSVEEIARGFAGTVEPPGTSWLRHALSRLNRAINVFAPGNVVEILRRSIFAAQIRMADVSSRRADFVIRPAVNRSRWHDYHRHADYIALGRKAAESVLPTLLSLVEPTPKDRHENAPPPPPRLAVALES